MKALFCSFMVFLAVSALRADYGAGGFLEALMAKGQPQTDQKPLTDQRNPFEHADFTPAMPSEVDVLAEPATDPVNTLKSSNNTVLDNITVHDPVREELKDEEEKENLAKGPLSGNSQKEDLDSKLNSQSLPASSPLRKAEPEKL